MGSDALASAPRSIDLRPRRRRTREVSIGDVVIGGTRPIAVQSMTTTRTADAQATAAQVAALARAGCAIVRVTVPSKPDAEALPEIRRILKRECIEVPLVADIHFTPKLALAVVEHVEKVRVNPGNFSDRKNIGEVRYDDERWERDVERVRELFVPVVDRARELGVALRVGTNHGSLSDRIVHRHGDTPEGMVESALEFVNICEERSFHDIVISMKASNTQVMSRAYRLLAERLDAQDSRYPLHLGVTEAGGGDEGRMKSSAGMALLLADGLGDTVRVSLTEDPVHEVPVARELVELFARDEATSAEEPLSDVIETRNPLDPLRRPSAQISVGPHAWGGEEPPRVELSITTSTDLEPLIFARPPVESVEIALDADVGIDATLDVLARIPGQTISRALHVEGEKARALVTGAEGETRQRLARLVDRFSITVRGDDPDAQLVQGLDLAGDRALLASLELEGRLAEGGAARVESFARALAGRGARTLATLVPAHAEDTIFAYRLLAAALDASGSRVPILLQDAPGAPGDPRIGFAGRMAGLLLDGIGDGVREPAGDEPRIEVARVHGILQAARRRLEKAEFIACPSCGRTLFDLEETTAKIRAITEHLKLKIGVMGCVVNGPGEMADADYGYVGWGEGKVALFVGREMVEKDIPSAEAPRRLVELIQSRGDWADPPEA